MQNLKLLMQTGILVANMVGKHDLGEARISYNQFDVTEKHPLEYPHRWRMLLIATGLGPDIRKPVKRARQPEVGAIRWRRPCAKAMAGRRSDEQHP